MNWNHRTVYKALVQRFGEEATLATKRYTWLYEPQKRQGEFNCALLYSPDSVRFSTAPLLVNRAQDTWREEVFQQVLPAIEYQRSDSENKTTRFEHYRVVDWAIFAQALGLDQS
jgi:hypothetical protein